LKTIEQKIESNRQSADGRMEYDSLYGFYIDTEKILLIEKAGYYSYTIPIKRDAENGKVENLVLSFDADGAFKSYLTAYSLTAEEKNQLSEGEKVANLETKTSIAALSDNAASSGGSGAGIFHDANGNCFVINHIWTDQSGTLAWNYVQVDCPADSGGSGEGSGDNTGSNPGGWPGNYPNPGGYENPGGGGTGENGGEVITEPILPNMMETPCAKLREKTQEIVFKNKLAVLKQPNILSQNHENGFFEPRASSSEPYLTVSADPRTHSLSAPPGLSFIGYAHTHQNDYIDGNGELIHTVKIFSKNDLVSFLGKCQISARAKGISYTETYGIVITSQGSYALKMLVGGIFVNAIDWERFEKKYNADSQKLIDEDNLNAPSVEKMLLRLLKKHGLNDKIGLYKATDPALTQWGRITLSNEENLTITPCN